MVNELPEGFRKVSVILTESEFEKLRREAIWTGSGTFSEAMRLRAGMPGVAYGLKVALKRLRAKQEEQLEAVRVLRDELEEKQRAMRERAAGS